MSHCKDNTSCAAELKSCRIQFSPDELRLGYDYEGDGEETKIYTLPFSGEFPTEEEAEMSRKLLARRGVMVRVSPRNPKRSCILDDDVRPLIATASE
jgi:hypothetical protein